ncbi:hypothetical protein GOP47_0020599 [Adiantum capillus-veneris]|uniref:Uncharacterized protein n=1 Tax=Adiantum capillus-veneris TaxID=13818 RepID=A0A9D4UB28_ADICA|nr:hypothetical protein GOP47_0020599 [Adiantum capillus-veneris]
MVRFEYISFIEQLRLLCQCEEFCHDFLRMWRARSSWQADSSTSTNVINDYWDGEKIRMCKDFWNPQKEWEIPVKCPNSFCAMYYRTFPTALRSPELNNNWNEITREYEFLCSHCATYIKVPRRMVKVRQYCNQFE